MHSLGGIPSAGSLCQDTAFCPHFLDTVLRSARFESLGAFEIILGRAFAGGEFEGLAQRLRRVEAVGEDLCDLTARHNAVAAIACLAFISLEEDETVLVRSIIVKPPERSGRRSLEPFSSFRLERIRLDRGPNLVTSQSDDIGIIP